MQRRREKGDLLQEPLADVEEEYDKKPKNNHLINMLSPTHGLSRLLWIFLFDAFQMQIQCQ